MEVPWLLPHSCEWGSNSIIPKWALRRKGGNGIETDSHLQRPTRQRYSQRHYQALPSTGYLWAMIPLTRLKVTERGLLWVFKTIQSHLSSWAQISSWGAQIKAIGPKWGWGDGLARQAQWALALMPIQYMLFNIPFGWNQGRSYMCPPKFLIFFFYYIEIFNILIISPKKWDLAPPTIWVGPIMFLKKVVQFV